MTPSSMYASSIVSPLSPPSGMLDDHLDGDPVFSRKNEIALVVRGHAHHDARAIFHQRVIGHEQGYAVSIDGVDDE